MSNPRFSTPSTSATSKWSHSQGSGSHYSYQSEHQQEKYKPYLENDLEHTQTITFDEFLHDVLHLPAGWIDQNAELTDRIVDDEAFKAKVDAYCQPVTDERFRYPPFVTLANHVISEFDPVNKTKAKNNQIIRDFCFCQNDATYIQGSIAKRKPDVVGVQWDTVYGVSDRSSIDNLMNIGPVDAPFWWWEVDSFLEFKLVQKDLRVPSTMPSPSIPAKRPSDRQKSDSRTRQKSGSRAMRTRSTPAFISTVTTAGPHRMVTCRASSSSAPSKITSTTASYPMNILSAAGGSAKRPMPTASSDTSQKSKKQKVDNVLPKVDPMLQCASYALEMMSYGAVRSHVIGALITDDKIQLLYYNHSIILVSEPLNFLENPTMFVAMLHAMVKLSRSQWGYILPLHPVPVAASPHTFNGMELKLCNGRRLRLSETVLRRHCLIGRGTCVVRATHIKEEGDDGIDEEGWNSKLIVKLSWPPASRIPEQNIITRARQTANCDEHRWVLKHLPKVLHAEDNDIDLLSRALIDRLGDQCEKRVFRLMVMEELFAVTERTNSRDLAETTCEIFDCYRWLFEFPKIIHRDISINNVMLRKEDNRVYGVLNDFDLAINVDSKSPSSRQRTGTRPFMALDLHGRDPLVHMCRHDLESLFYVLIWITSRFHHGEEVADPPLQPWEIQNDPSMLATKSHFIAFSQLPPRTKEFEPHAECLYALQTMFSDGFTARRKIVNARSAELTHSQYSDFDYETLGGFVTFDKFREIITNILR